MMTISLWKRTLLLAILELITAPLQASKPMWTYTPLTPTTLAIAPNELIEVRYLIQNQATRPKNLIMRAIQGIVPLNTCYLKAKGSCVLTLQINGSTLKQEVMDGPILCQTGNSQQCYRPSPSDILRVTKTTNPPNASFFAVGHYYDTNNVLRPLLASNLDAGKTWAFPSAINSPLFTPNNPYPFTNFGSLSSISCQKQHCVTAGEYNVDTNSRPLIATSADRGINWTFPSTITALIFTPNLSYDFSSGGLYEVSCANTNCVTVGYYIDTNGVARPLISVSHDAGQNWVFPSAPTAPVFTPNDTNPFSAGQLANISCHTNVCVGVGSYNSGALPRPLLGISQNNGDSWIFPASTNAPQFTPDNTHAFSLGAFYSASCFNDVCTAAGIYIDTSATLRPLLTVSQNQGVTWVFPSAITAPVFTPTNNHPFSSSGFLTSTSCSAEGCIAAGNYNDGVVQRPLLAVSQDKGLTWIFPTEITEPVFQPNNTNAYTQAGDLLGTTCQDKTCLAVGHYLDPNGVQRPMIAASQDAGLTWTYPNVNAPVFTPDNSNAFKDTGVLNNVSCQNNLCMASGSYMDVNDISRPLIVLSSDKGKTWTYPSAPTSPIFTPDNDHAFQSGLFKDSRVLSSSLEMIYQSF